jgi:predicted CoA-binding protein
MGATFADMDDVEAGFVEDDAAIRAVARDARRVAVLGMKTEAQAGQPAFYVAAALAADGVEIVPVPVYYPEVTQILGRPVVRRVADAPGPIDIVCVFRRPSDLAGHLDDLLAARPAVVWLQQGIRDDAFAATLAQAGISVVQDRCLMVERRLAKARG